MWAPTVRSVITKRSAIWQSVNPCAKVSPLFSHAKERDLEPSAAFAT
jgi:hypothetical protein